MIPKGLRRNLIPIVAQGYALICAFATTVLLARYLGAESFGRFVVLTTLGMLGGELASGGYSRVLARIVPKMRVRGQSSGMVVLSCVAGTLVIALPLATLGIWGFALLDRGTSLDDDMAEAARWMLSIIPFAALLALASAVFFAHRRTVAASLPDRVIRPSLFLAALLGAMQTGSSVVTLGIGFFLSYLLTAIYSLVLLGVLLRSENGFRRMPDARHLKTYFRYSMNYWFSAFLVAFRERSVILLFGLVGSPMQVSLYAASNRIVVTMRTFFNITRNTYQSQLAESYNLRDFERIRIVYQRIVVQQAVLAIPVIGVFVFVPSVWGAIFGAEFAGVYWVGLIAFGGSLINVFLGSAGTVLIMSNQNDWIRKPALFSLLITVVLTAVLGWSLGAIGAALASSIGTVILALACWGRARQTLHLSLSFHKMWRTIVASVMLAILASLAVYWIENKMGPSG